MAQAPTQTALKGKKILVIEDQFLIRIDLQELLERCGATVRAAPSVSRGCQLLSEHDFDAAILDMRVTDGSVLPLAEKLKAASVPIAFHSGHAKASALRDDFPDARCLAKPASDSELIGALSELIASDDTVDHARSA